MKRGIAIQRHVFLTVFRLRSLTEASSEAPQTRGDSGAGREQGCHSDAQQKFTTNVLEFYEAGDQHCRPWLDWKPAGHFVGTDVAAQRPAVLPTEGQGCMLGGAYTCMLHGVPAAVCKLRLSCSCRLQAQRGRLCAATCPL